MAEAHPRNAPGPFYIENECCLACGIPESIAPDLFGWDNPAEHAFHCFVSRQPESYAEVDLMFRVMKQADLDCLRYRGSDEEIRRRLIEEGHGDRCD